MTKFRDSFCKQKKFNLTLLPKKVIEQDNTGEYRTYLTPEGKKYPSITSVLSANPEKHESLQKWKDRVGEEEARKVSQKATVNGTAVHDNLEKYVLGEQTTTINTQYKSIKNVLDKRVDNVVGVEIPVYSDIIKIAGTADLVAEFDGIMSVIDYKTALRLKREEHIKDYFIQSTFYALAIEEMYGIIVPQIVILIGVVGEPSAQVFIKKRRDFIKDLVKARKLLN